MGNYFSALPAIRGRAERAGDLDGRPCPRRAARADCAIWATLTNLIPQVGGFLGGGFFAPLALTKGPVQGVIALVLFLVYQQIENHLIQPAIVGTAVHLTPPTTMLAALVGGAAAGVPGALAATPLVGTVKSLYLEFRSGSPAPSVRSPFRLPWRRRKGAKGKKADKAEKA